MYFYLIHTRVLPAHMYIYSMRAWCLHRPEMGVGSLYVHAQANTPVYSHAPHTLNKQELQTLPLYTATPASMNRDSWL